MDVLQDARLKWNDTDRSPTRHSQACLGRRVTGGIQGISAHRNRPTAVGDRLGDRLS
ncbi:hypothetical protein [Nocardia gipuzkoensis]|uniref:hypothetical protein n=1 Tax=Nocardia gipuzkoensis TaxID=2749991 RepID=UPI0015EEE38B|nr:hypothetical protein [Nocardia gipuzkoensis]